MSSSEYPYPVAVSQLTDGDSREAQAVRALEWLDHQAGGPVVVVTPRRGVEGVALVQLVKRPDVLHLTWKGFIADVLAEHRVVHAWPDKPQLDALWGVGVDALVVLEWGQRETAQWIQDALPLRLLAVGDIATDRDEPDEVLPPLPDDVDGILQHVANMAAGYSSGLKWNEEDQLKADMMNAPKRWESVSLEQVRSRLRELGMRPADVTTIAGYLQRRKEGRRFTVRNSYRDFRFRS